MLLLVVASPALAWRERGHQVVAEVAQARLAPATRADVARLLALESASRLSEVANWADELRRAGGARAKATERWHFVNFGEGCRYAPARDCPDGNCIIGAIHRQALVLGDRRRPDTERLEALKWLVHLVGDAHQPLHASARDQGGNHFQVQLDGKGSNLHAVWDLALPDRLVAAAGGDPATYAATLPVGTRSESGVATGPGQQAAHWAIESCELVDSAQIFPSTHVIGASYLDAQAPLAAMRLRRAGERLATLLDAVLVPSRRPSAAVAR